MRGSKRRSGFLSSGALIASLSAAAGATPAIAQEAEIAAASDSEIITVTAQRREENIIDVPIAVTAFGADDIEDRGFATLESLQYAVPNFTATNEFQSVTPRFSVRGVSSNTRNIGFESGLSVYVDGVFTGRPSSQTFDLTDVASIEVLRGPQGTLYGKNNTAGAININTSRPGDELRYNAMLEAGNFNLIRVGGDISGPLSESVGAKLALFSAQRDGTVDNIFDGSELNTIDSLGGRAGLFFELDPTFDASIIVDYFRDRHARGFTEPVDGQPAAVPGPRTVNINVNGNEDRDSGGVAITFDKRFGNDIELTSITGYRFTDLDNIFIDNDDTPANGIAVDGWEEHGEHFTQELRLASDTGGAFDWTLGAYYFHQSVDSQRPTFAFGFSNNSIAEVETESWAFFGQAIWRPTDRLTLTSGLRFTTEDKELINFVQDTQVVFPAFGPVSDSISDEDISPMVSAVYELSDNANIYATIAQGYKSGGFNADFISDPSLLSFDSETVVNHEIGYKAVLFDGRLRVGAALFRMNYEDLQVVSFNQLLSGFFVQNAAQATIDGFELEFDAALTDELTLTGAVGLLDARYDSFVAAEAGDQSGNFLPDAPETTANLALQYRRVLGNGGAIFGLGEWSYRGERFADPNNHPVNAYVEDISLLNARIGYAGPGDRWEISLWGRNLADVDRQVFRFRNGFSGQVSATYNDPQTYGVTLRVRQ